MSEFEKPPQDDSSPDAAEHRADAVPPYAGEEVATAEGRADASGDASDFAGFQNGAPETPPSASAPPPAKPPLRTSFFARIIQALWFGSGVFVAFAAIAVFKYMNPTYAADAVGVMLTRWHYIALLAPAVLILVEWRRMRSRMVIILFIAVLLAVLQGFTDLRIRRIRMESPVAISALDRNDPVRRHFGMLHGFSSVLLLAQIAAAAAAIAAEPER